MCRRRIWKIPNSPLIRSFLSTNNRHPRPRLFPVGPVPRSAYRFTYIQYCTRTTLKRRAVTNFVTPRLPPRSVVSVLGYPGSLAEVQQNCHQHSAVRSALPPTDVDRGFFFFFFFSYIVRVPVFVGSRHGRSAFKSAPFQDHKGYYYQPNSLSGFLRKSFMILEGSCD